MGGGGDPTTKTSRVTERDLLTFQAPLMPLFSKPVLRSLRHSIFELLLGDLENVIRRQSTTRTLAPGSDACTSSQRALGSRFFPSTSLGKQRTDAMARHTPGTGAAA